MLPPPDTRTAAIRDLAAFVRVHPCRSFRKGHIIFYQHDTPQSLLAIRSGFIKVHDLSDDGSEQLIWLAKKYDILPLEWLFGASPHADFFYTAFTDVEVFTIPRQEFLNFASQRQDILLAIIDAMATKYNDLLHRLNAAQKPRAREKVVHALLFIATRFTGTDQPGLATVTLPITHQDIASLIGLTRETTARELKKLKDEGLVSYNKGSFAIHAAQLRSVA